MKETDRAYVDIRDAAMLFPYPPLWELDLTDQP